MYSNADRACQLHFLAEGTLSLSWSADKCLSFWVAHPERQRLKVPGRRPLARAPQQLHHAHLAHRKAPARTRQGLAA